MLFVNLFSILVAILLKRENKSVSEGELDEKKIFFVFWEKLHMYGEAVVYNLHFVISSAYEKRKLFGLSNDFLLP